MKRIMIAPIDDERAEKASVLLLDWSEIKTFYGERMVDLADAKLLARDLRDITNFAVGMADMLDERGPANPERSGDIRASVARLRAAAGLDNE